MGAIERRWDCVFDNQDYISTGPEVVLVPAVSGGVGPHLRQGIVVYFRSFLV